MTERCNTCGRDCFCARSVNLPHIYPLPTFKREEVTEVSTMNNRGDAGNTPLMNAIEGLNQQIVELVIQKLDKEGINAKNSKGRTALHSVANIIWFEMLWRAEDEKFNQVKTAKLLIDAGADINIQDDEGLTPLHLACRSNNYELVKLLIDKGANVNPEPQPQEQKKNANRPSRNQVNDYCWDESHRQFDTSLRMNKMELARKERPNLKGVGEF